jgi:hypothetical protein
LGNSSGDETGSPVIRVYDGAGNVIETHEHAGDFKGGDVLVPLKEGLPACSVFRQTASMEAEIDCKLQSFCEATRSFANDEPNLE